MSLVFPSSTPTVPVAGTDRLFPVRRIYCVGRNYAAQPALSPTMEEGNLAKWLVKPGDAVAPLGGRLPYPPDTSNLHHEVELVAAIVRGGADIAEESALDHVFGYAVGIDLTKRDRQNEAKAVGQPWERSKAFDLSARISAIVPASAPPTGAIELSVNGAARQRATLDDMIWSTAEIVARLSRIWTLAPGDLIFTGTPEGVAAVQKGDLLEGGVEGVGTLKLRIG